MACAVRRWCPSHQRVRLPPVDCPPQFTTLAVLALGVGARRVAEVRAGHGRLALAGMVVHRLRSPHSSSLHSRDSRLGSRRCDTRTLGAVRSGLLQPCHLRAQCCYLLAQVLPLAHRGECSGFACRLRLCVFLPCGLHALSKEPSTVAITPTADNALDGRGSAIQCGPV